MIDILAFLFFALILGVFLFLHARKTKAINQVSMLSVPEDLPEGCFSMKIGRVVDGDTFHAEWVKLPWNAALVDTTVRCAGYDAFEKSKKRRSRDVSDVEVSKGKAAIKHFEELVAKSTSACIKPNRPEFDCFGRSLGFVYLKIDGEYVDLSKEMIAKGFDRNA